MRTILRWAFSLVFLSSVTSVCADEESGAEFWRRSANKELLKVLMRERNTKVAKNVIAFLGDGMGIPTITAARILSGQQQGRKGEEGKLVFENFPDVALIKTYNVDRQVPDSAATATAIFCGVKTNYEMLGVSAKAEPKNCSSSLGNEISSILDWAQQAGKDTGIVTTTRLTHATPASLYSHTPTRYWEHDGKIPESEKACKDIARQMVEDEPGRNVKVILGGGRRSFLSNNTRDKNDNIGHREDGLNLIAQWQKHKEDIKSTSAYVTTSGELKAVNIAETDYLLGVFNNDHLDYDLDRTDGNEQPTLTEMTKTAIQFLKKNQKGFFLMVEGGRIDHAHHENRAGKALYETLAFDEAIRATLDLVDTDQDTLVVVTADHSHVMTINGYPVRGSPILGVGDKSDIDQLPFTTLMYTTGPSAGNDALNRRTELKDSKITEDKEYRQLSLVPNEDETHGGEDVAIYAKGPMSHLFTGVQEQNYIAHAMAYASCLGDNKDHCKSTSTQLKSPYVLVILLALYSLHICFLRTKTCRYHYGKIYTEF